MLCVLPIAKNADKFSRAKWMNEWMHNEQIWLDYHECLNNASSQIYGKEINVMYKVISTTKPGLIFKSCPL